MKLGITFGSRSSTISKFWYGADTSCLRNCVSTRLNSISELQASPVMYTGHRHMWLFDRRPLSPVMRIELSCGVSLPHCIYAALDIYSSHCCVMILGLVNSSSRIPYFLSGQGLTALLDILFGFGIVQSRISCQPTNLKSTDRTTTTNWD